jgi:HlyD family secretion protein
MTGKKLLLIFVLVAVVAGVVVGTVLHSRSDVPAVTTAKAVRGDLVSTVSGTGQIKPKTYVNVGATSFGRITRLYVKEGDHVTAGQLLATVESEQPASAVAAQQATIASSRTNVDSFVAAEKTAAANVEEAVADLEQKKFDYQRAQALYDDKLIAKQDFDAKKSAYDVDVATLAQRKAAVIQAKAQTDSARSQVSQNVAMLRGDSYSLGLTRSLAPFDGLVTNVPVREGETVVVGIQNAEGSTLMTLADMSVITAEVKVDETDIVNIALGQTAQITIDAFPNQTFTGKVTEVGDQALLRTTGVATSQSTTGTEEAKDFKVVVTLDSTKIDLRPGLSCTAKITTAHKPDTLTIPIQALVMRDPVEEAALYKNHGKASSSAPATPGKQSALVQGVYLFALDDSRLRVRFVPVTTGVTGTTDIEVLSGLKPSDEIVTGHYKILRTLKSGIAVKRDTSIATPVESDDSSS